MEHQEIVNLSQTKEIKENPQSYKKSIKKSGNRIGFNYIIVKIIKESQKNDVVKCFYMKKISDFGFCVIKEGTTNDLKDKAGRDIKDRLHWQKSLHETLHGKIRIPRLVGSFEENGNYYLAIEYINGTSFGEYFRRHSAKLREGLMLGNRLGRKTTKFFIKAIILLDKLHKLGFVHRDATSANFIIMRSGKVVLIDLELSYSMPLKKPFPPFQLGTHGYMSPEQLSVEVPTEKEDVFAVGAMLLQAWTGISPNKLTEVAYPELYEKIGFFIPDVEISGIIRKCLSSEPSRRPQLKDVILVFEKYITDSRRKIARNTVRGSYFSRENLQETVQAAINTFSTKLLADTDNGWFAQDKKSQNVMEKSKLDKAWYASFHVGVSGILYMLSRAHRTQFNISKCQSNIKKALELIESKYITPDKRQPGLHFGSDGIAVSLVESLKTGLLEKKENYEDWIDKLLKTESSGNDIMNGRAGQIMANLICHELYPSAEMLVRAKSYVDTIVSAQQLDGSWVRNDGMKQKRKRVTNGFPLGMSGIICSLYDFAEIFKDTATKESADNGLRWLIHSAIKKDGIMIWKSSLGKDINPWWRDGSPGIVLSLLKGYSLNKDPHLKAYAESALNYHSKEVFSSNLSQCNGLAGLGEVYLEAYKVFGDDQWYQRAGWIAQLLARTKKDDTKHGTYWLCENELQPLPGFMLGNAGILHFFIRYLNPEIISLPLSVQSKAK